MNHVPPTSAKKEKPMGSSFNLTQMVSNFIIAKMLLGLCEKGKFDDSVSYISGIVRGYNDWFTALHIQQGVFEQAIKSLDKTECARMAQDLFLGISEASKKPLIEIPGVPAVDVRKIVDNLSKGKG